MIRTVHSLPVGRTPHDAFAFVSDLRNAAAWDPRVTRAARTTGGDAGLGTRFELTARLAGPLGLRLAYEIVVYEPPRRCVFRGGNLLWRYTDDVTVRPDGHGAVVVTYASDFGLRGVLAPFTFLFARTYRRMADEATEGIRGALEERARRGDGGRRTASGRGRRPARHPGRDTW